MPFDTKGARPNKPAQVIVYTRFSPRPDAQTSDSAEVQQAICEEFAYKKGWEVIEVFTDQAISGSVGIDDRPGLAEAISNIRKGRILLVMKRDRLARDLMVGLQIERVVESRGGIVACAQGEPFGNDPNAVMLKQMLMVIAEWERKMISERTRNALRAKMRAGKRVGGRQPPYGWQVDPTDKHRTIINEREQIILRVMVELRKRGMSLGKIAKVLDPSMARAGYWHPEIIRLALARIEYLPLPELSATALAEVQVELDDIENVGMVDIV